VERRASVAALAPPCGSHSVQISCALRGRSGHAGDVSIGVPVWVPPSRHPASWNRAMELALERTRAYGFWAPGRSKSRRCRPHRWQAFSALPK
jgi:hypothetical protein